MEQTQGKEHTAVAESHEQQYTETTIRPSHPEDNQISFLWTPGKQLCELLYRPGQGLKFAVKDGAGTRVADQFGDFSPLKWVADFARLNAIRLPSDPKPYQKLDHLGAVARRFIHKYFDCGEAFESVAVLYALHTWVYEKFHAVPYLRFLGISGSGKTRGTETIGAICYRPLVLAGSATSAPMFRLIEGVGGTMLIDEADFQDSQIGTDIAKILNCGYQKGLPVTRMDQINKRFVPRLFEVFGPKIINGRRPFKDDATESRCLSYTPALTERQDVPPQIPPEFEDEARTIRNMALAWRLDALDAFRVDNIVMPALRRRTNQILLPLFAIADQMERENGEAYKADLLRYATSLESQALEGRKDTTEARLLQAYMDLPRLTAPTCKEVADRAVLDAGENDPKLREFLTPKRAGGILVNMGFETKHTKRGSEVWIDRKRLPAILKRYGIVIERSPEPSPSGDCGDDLVMVVPRTVTATTYIN